MYRYFMAYVFSLSFVRINWLAFDKNGHWTEIYPFLLNQPSYVLRIENFIFMEQNTRDSFFELYSLLLPNGVL